MYRKDLTKIIPLVVSVITMNVTSPNSHASDKSSQPLDPIVRMYLEPAPIQKYKSLINSIFVSYDEKGRLLGRSSDTKYSFPLKKVTELKKRELATCVYRYENGQNEVKFVTSFDEDLKKFHCPERIFDTGKLLQETIDYAIKGGFPLKVTSRAYISGKHAKLTPFLTSYRTIHIPPATTTSIEFNNVVLLSMPIDNGPGLHFDSAEGLHFEQKGGQILYRGTKAAVLFKPENPTINADDATQINTSKIKFSAITVQEQAENYGGVPVRFDISKGPIWSNYFEFGETDGFNKGDYVIEITGSTSITDKHRFFTSFESNKISASLLARANKAGIKIGSNENDRALITGNSWDIGSIEPGKDTAVGVLSYGANDRFSVGNVGSRHFGPGLSSAFEFFGDKSNKVNVGSIHDNTHPFFVTPHLIKTLDSFNIVGFLNKFFGIPHSAGEVKWVLSELQKIRGIIVADTLQDVEKSLQKHNSKQNTKQNDNSGYSALYYDEPILIKSINNFNIVGYKNKVYGVPQSAGEIRWGADSIEKIPGIIIGTSSSEIEKRIKESSGRRSFLNSGDVLNDRNIYYIDIANIECNNNHCPAFTKDHKLMRFDGGHWTLNGAKYFAEKLMTDKNFQELKPILGINQQ